LLLDFCAAQRRRCASAMRLRASGLRTRVFLDDFLAADFVLRCDEVKLFEPDPASNFLTCVSLAISESI